ncbi:hypothetical protein NFI96_005185 [Prochilodus magdalenae]|nr:hypothetical protein NFI96_005185 [Prochilodus magdalenae]
MRAVNFRNWGKGYTALVSAVKSNPSSCLIELDLKGNDPGETGVKKMTDLLKSPNCKLTRITLSNSSITVEGCAALSSAICSNPSHLIELDLNDNELGNSGVKQICSLLSNQNCKLQKLGLSNSSITDEGCAALSSAICLNPSHLIELDLSKNKLENSGVKQICSLLNNKSCKLKRLGLSFCRIKEEGYTALASALKSNTSSHLTDLDLRGNDPGATGVKKLTDLLECPDHKLKTLSLLNSSAAEEACKYLNKVLGVNPLLEREMNLSGNIKGDSDMKKISHLLKDQHCRTQILKLSNSSITVEGCAALSSAICSNPSHLIELDLSENELENSGVKQICYLLSNQNCKLQNLGLSKSSITDEGCAALSSALCLNPLHLIELDLSENNLENSGVKQICSLLNNKSCKLQRLRITEEGYAALASALKSNTSSHLTDLDLRGNDPGATGVKKLTDLLNDQHCKLKTLSLLNGSAAEEACEYLTKVLGVNPLLERELDLSAKIKGDSDMKMISHLLKDLHCRTQILKLKNCSITQEGCAALSSALCLNPSHLIELDLSENKLGNSGVKQICSLLNNGRCKLQRLRLSHCSITEEGYVALASALKSNTSSHLTDLDLRENDPGDTGVKKLIDLLEGPDHKLKTLSLLNSSAAEEACEYLTEVLGVNPLLEKELDLSGKIKGDSDMKKISHLLEDSHCRPNKLMLGNSSITEKGCAALSSAICLNPSHLIELDLSENKLGNSGVKQICGMLQNHKVVLQKLDITAEGYAALTSVLKSNPSSHLKELDLRGNDPGNSGVKMVIGILEDPNSKLKTLRLSKSSLTEEGCAALSSAIDLNPSHLIELDLSENKLENSGINPICNLLNKERCKLQRLRLSHCSITEEGYAALASALKSNTSSHLTDLDLRGNDPGDTGVKKLIDLLKVPEHKLKTLSLLNSSAAEEACEYLTKVLGVNPLLERELDLSAKIKGDSDMKMISHLLKDLHCRTQILKLKKSSITEEGCAALSSAICLNPSHLKELDLCENKLENSGVKQICSLLNSPRCKLQKLAITEEGYTALASAVKSNPSSHLTELDLTGNNPGETGVKEITELLQDPNCKLTRITLKNSSITEEGCAALSSALCLNPSHLIELVLSENELENTGVKQICSLLNNQNCKLQRLRLSHCSITEEGYAALASALKSNPSSHLTELDLRGNDPGDTGVKMIIILLKGPDHKLKTLSLLNSSAAEEACEHLTEVLGVNPLLERELDLSGKIKGDSDMKMISHLLEDPHCRSQILNITEEGYTALASAVKSNPSSHLTELDLTGNNPGETGVKEITELLQDPNCKLTRIT